MAGWLTKPLQLDGMRMSDCDEKTPAECDWYRQKWHFWYIADWVFALPTIAFFMCSIGIFIIANVLSTFFSFLKKKPRGPRKLLAGWRYLSYRGWHVKSLRWNSAPLGVLLLGGIGTIYFFCMDLAPKPYYWIDKKFGGSPPLATRSGWLALACMPFIFATATKANWITLVSGVSHERLQVFHRWISYAFFILALLHTFPFIVYHVHFQDMQEHFKSSLLFYWTGIAALTAQAWLTFLSHSTIRRFGYEFFKATHLLAAVIFIVTFFWHVDFTLTSADYFVATAAIYVPCYIYPYLRTFFEYGGIQRATLSLSTNNFIRIAVPAKFNWKPGQHCFLRFTGFGIASAVSSHPFTICSTPSSTCASELVFYIRPHGGFTKKLRARALECPGSSVGVLVDGPYGGIALDKFSDADCVLLVAGGSGAGWCLPFIERYVMQYSQSGDAYSDAEKGKTLHVETRGLAGPVSLRIVLATRDTANRQWFLGAVDELLAKCGGSASGLNVQVYLTGDAALAVETTTERGKTASPAASVSESDGIEGAGHERVGHVPGREHEGRPHLSSVVAQEASKVREGGQALSVFVCGPTTMQNDVRNAVAAENLRGLKGSAAESVYLHSEHFSWA